MKLEVIAVQKAALSSALDSAVNVVAETRTLVRDNPEMLTPGDRQKLSVTLEQMGRMCFSVAREIERPAAPVGKEGN